MRMLFDNVDGWLNYLQGLMFETDISTDGLTEAQCFYLSNDLVLQKPVSFQDIWISAAKTQEEKEERINDFEDSGQIPYLWLPTRLTESAAPFTIIHEKLLGSHSSFIDFIDLFIDEEIPISDNKRIESLFSAYIYGISLNGEFDFSTNRPLELAVHAMLNKELPDKERADIQKNLRYLLSKFMEYEKGARHENNLDLLDKLNRFINGLENGFELPSAVYAKCLYCLSKIWSQLHMSDQQTEILNHNEMLPCLTYIRNQGHLRLLKRLLPESYAVTDAVNIFGIAGITDYNAVESDICKHLGAAISEGDVDVLNIFLNYDAVCDLLSDCTTYGNDRFGKLLQQAIESNHLGMVTSLLALDVAQNKAAENDNAALLDFAIPYGNIEFVKLLLKIPSVRKKILTRNNGAINLAAIKGDIDLFELLIELPEVVNHIADNDNVVLQAACDHSEILSVMHARHHRSAIVKRLLEIPAVLENANAGDNKALRNAVLKNLTGVAKMLLNIPNVFENIAVHHNNIFDSAVYNGNLDIIEVLLSNESVYRQAAMSENKALRIAHQNGHTHVVDRLLRIHSVAKGEGAAEIIRHCAASQKGAFFDEDIDSDHPMDSESDDMGVTDGVETLKVV